MKIVLASHNKKKINELQALLSEVISDIEILSPEDVGIVGDIEETGTTFEENALIKARAVSACGYIGIGDDSGLSVAALDGAPGIYSARYSGEHGNDAANNALLLKNMENTDDRSAQFICAVACVFPDGDSFTVRGYVDGEILRSGRGKDGFGYDPLFYYPPFGKTFAELNADEKNAISHRGMAIRLLTAELSRRREKRK